MIEIDIPGFGLLRLRHLVSDFTGTLSVDGRLEPGVKERLGGVAGLLKIHVLTSDTFGTAAYELAGADCEIRILEGDGHDRQKEDYVKGLGPESVIAIGNGRNDALMLKAARVGVVVSLSEGCSTAATASGDVLVKSAVDALDLVLNPLRLKATLRG